MSARDMPVFDPSLARKPLNYRKTDPETSVAASESHTSRRTSDREQALRLLKASPDGLTDFELGDRMQRQQTSAGKRRGELPDFLKHLR